MTVPANFQSFFFDTYPGYFLEALPIALLVGAVYGILRFRGDHRTPLRRRVWSVLFVCYLAGLLCLVLGLKLMQNLWYFLIYHRSGGIGIQWFTPDFQLVPDFWWHVDGERIGNIFLFLPFGVLYPLSRDNSSWGRTVLAGFACSLGIEVLQPIFGRSFDINDIFFNTLGVLVSAPALVLLLPGRGRNGKHK